METDSLLGKTVLAVRVFRSEGVHPAWVDANTLPIVAFDAFLEMAGGESNRISPCEVDMGPERYPSLGLEFQSCTAESMHAVSAGGRIIETMALDEARPLMPFVIAEIEESDPLGEDVVSQLALVDGSGRKLIFRHIMPPMTLGIRVDLE